jgi:hypothetical protein
LRPRPQMRGDNQAENREGNMCGAEHRCCVGGDGIAALDLILVRPLLQGYSVGRLDGMDPPSSCAGGLGRHGGTPREAW